MYASWPCPTPSGGMGEEMALVFDARRGSRLLVIPPFFEEANKFRHQILETMSRLDELGVDSICPDLPGCNESLIPHSAQSLAAWRIAAIAAANHFSATHVLAFRSGCWIVPTALPGWLYAPSKPGQVLRAMLRARTIAAREAGRQETAASLLERGRREGLDLAGWELGSALIGELEATELGVHDHHNTIDHSEIGGRALWLRAENDFDPEQAEALAALIAAGISS